MNSLLGERSRVLRSSRVRVRGRLLSPALRACCLLVLVLKASLLLARGGGAWVALPWLLRLCERGDCGGEA